MGCRGLLYYAEPWYEQPMQIIRSWSMKTAPTLCRVAEFGTCATKFLGCQGQDVSIVIFSLLPSLYLTLRGYSPEVLQVVLAFDRSETFIVEG